MHAAIWRYHNDFFEQFKDELEWGDLNCLNQETILVDESLGYGGYPNFGTPYYVGDTELKYGYNVICCATNHTMDKHIEGVKSTLSYWDTKDVNVLGVHSDPNDTHYTVTEVNGITFALFNYTYGTNGIPVPDEYSYMVDVDSSLEFKKKDGESKADYIERIRSRFGKSRLLADVKEVNDLVDVVIVFPHWGEEYRYDATVCQEVVGTMLTEAGADIIIGTHPHVIEPMVVIEADNGNKCICYYSLGNFIHGQDRWERCLGAMAKIVVQKDDGKIYIEATAEPNVCQQLKYIENVQNWTFFAYKLTDYTEELCQKHRLRADGMTLENLWGLWNKVFKTETPRLTIEYQN